MVESRVPPRRDPQPSVRAAALPYRAPGNTGNLSRRSAPACPTCTARAERQGSLRRPRARRPRLPTHIFRGHGRPILLGPPGPQDLGGRGGGGRGVQRTRAVLCQTRHAPQLAGDRASGSTGHREKEGRGTSRTESPCAGRVCCLGVIRDLGSAERKQTTSGIWGRNWEALEGNQRASSGDGWG